jgi:hypothetical protein
MKARCRKSVTPVAEQYTTRDRGIARWIVRTATDICSSHDVMGGRFITAHCMQPCSLFHFSAVIL